MEDRQTFTAGVPTVRSCWHAFLPALFKFKQGIPQGMPQDIQQDIKQQDRSREFRLSNHQISTMILHFV